MFANIDTLADHDNGLLLIRSFLSTPSGVTMSSMASYESIYTTQPYLHHLVTLFKGDVILLYYVADVTPIDQGSWLIVGCCGISETKVAM